MYVQIRVLCKFLSYLLVKVLAYCRPNAALGLCLLCRGVTLVPTTGLFVMIRYKRLGLDCKVRLTDILIIIIIISEYIKK